MLWPGRAKLVAMSELLTQRMQPSATKLQLLRLADAVDTLVARAQESQVRVLEFLHLVLEEEVRVRAGRRFKQALKLAGLPDHKILDGFELTFQPDLDAVRFKELAILAVRRAKSHCDLPRPSRDRRPI
jgi:hypothetical protein